MRNTGGKALLNERYRSFTRTERGSSSTTNTGLLSPWIVMSNTISNNKFTSSRGNLAPRNFSRFLSTKRFPFGLACPGFPRATVRRLRPPLNDFVY